VTRYRQTAPSPPPKKTRMTDCIAFFLPNLYSYRL
jgi:hypothetical protein